MKLLMVDDEERVTTNLQAIVPWETLGIKDILVAGSGEAAYSLYREHAPDLVLTDIMMKRMSGIELIEKIRAIDPVVPIIILSAYDTFSYACEAVRFNVHRYILKPIVPVELIQTLQEAVAELAEKRAKADFSSHMQSLIAGNIGVLRERFLYDMLTDTVKVDEAFTRKLDFYGIDERLLRGGKVMTLQAFAPEGGKVRSDRDWHIYKFAIRNIVQETAASDGGDACYVLPYVGDRLSILFAGASGDEELTVRCAGSIIERVYHYLEIDVNIGIGYAYESPLQYARSLQESMEALHFGEFEGRQRIDRIGKVREYGPDVPARFRESMRLLLEAIHNADWHKALESWSGIEELAGADEAVAFDYLQACCTGALSGMALAGGRLGVEPLLERLQGVNSYRSKADLMTTVRRQLEEEAQVVPEERAGSPYLQHIIHYVEEHYHEEISFSKLAKELHLSRTYLSYLFKREMNTTFIQYLIDYRMNVAKRLISASRHLMIREVGEMVGYSDPAYFSRMFKNSTGLSPSEYQARCCTPSETVQATQ